jgi:RNA polymerase-binding protein DksA
MPTEQQLAALNSALRQRLQQLREEIRDELLRADDQSYVELAGQVHDRHEESFADLLVDIQLADIDRHIQEVHEVEAALKRLQEGNYGNCEDCAEPIALERLQVQPAARRCLRCQSAYERTHSGGAGRKL